MARNTSHAAERCDRPVILLRQTPDPGRESQQGQAPVLPGHGEWTLADADAARGATRWHCPAGQCAPASVRVKASRLHPLIPRGTARCKGLYHQRGTRVGALIPVL
jgi:hypothetical protein